MNSNEDTWTRTWTWTGGYESGRDLVIDLQDDIYVVGYILMPVEESDKLCLLKYNKMGVLIWNQLWDQESLDWGPSIAIDNSENIYITGGMNKDVLLIKCTNQGEIIWNRTWGGLGDDRCYTIITDSLNNVYLAGSTTSFGSGSWNGFIVKFNSSGFQIWDRTWGTTDSDWFGDICIDHFNNIFLAGASKSNAVLVKFNSSGYEQWNATVDYSSPFSKLKVDSENNIIYATENLLQKFNNSGNNIWIRALTEAEILEDLTIDNYDNIYILDQRESPCPPDNFFFGGILECICGAIYLEKYNGSGEFIWRKRCTTGCISANGKGIFLDSSSNIYICGTLHGTTGCMNMQDILLMKNPRNCTVFCPEIYYDLIAIGIGVPAVIIVAINVIIFKKRRSKRKN